MKKVKKPVSSEKAVKSKKKALPKSKVKKAQGGSYWPSTDPLINMFRPW